MKTQKIIIEVEGGVVVAVYSNNPNIQAEVMDRDNLEDHEAGAEEEKELDRLEKEIREMGVIL